MPDVASLAGSVLCAGFPGTDPEPAVLDELRALEVGAVVLFARNVSDLARTQTLVAAARERFDGLPPLVCLDQEGGRVARLRFGGELPSMLSLGATGDAALAERAGARLAAELRAVGANVAFAPVLDLALEPRGTVIGTRSLGDDPERVARLGAALVRGLEGGGVAACAKHFPGHGATAQDSHVSVAVVGASAATLRTRELVPFRAAFAAGARSVMSAHVVIAALDGARPASLSSAVLTDLLRGDLGFGGVCFTDCLQMEAVGCEPGTVQAAVAALAAGADALVVSSDLALVRAARDAIVDAVCDGTLPLARLTEASARVAALRAAFPQVAPSTLPPYPADDGLAAEIAARAVALVRGAPALERDLPVTVISFEGDDADGVAARRGERPSLSLALRRRGLRSELLRVAPSPDPAMRDMLVEVVRAQGRRNVVVVMRRAHLRPDQAAAVDAMVTVAPDAVAVSALEPFDVAVAGRARTVLCSFGDDEANVEAVADVLCGRRAPSGSLPVTLAAAPA